MSYCGQAAIGVEARGVVPGVGDGDDFIGGGGGLEAAEAGFDGVCGANDCGAESALDGGALEVVPERLHGVDGGKQLDGLIANEAEESLLRRGEKALRFGVGLGGDDLDGHGEPGLLQHFTGAEAGAIEVCGGLK